MKIIKILGIIAVLIGLAVLVSKYYNTGGDPDNPSEVIDPSISDDVDGVINGYKSGGKWDTDLFDRSINQIKVITANDGMTDEKKEVILDILRWAHVNFLKTAVDSFLSSARCEPINMRERLTDDVNKFYNDQKFTNALKESHAALTDFNTAWNIGASLQAYIDKSSFDFNKSKNFIESSIPKALSLSKKFPCDNLKRKFSNYRSLLEDKHYQYLDARISTLKQSVKHRNIEVEEATEKRLDLESSIDEFRFYNYYSSSRYSKYHDLNDSIYKVKKIIEQQSEYNKTIN
jgi:hypothetical protein